MPAALGSVNVYLIRGPKGVALIDTGLDDSDCRQALLSGLKKNGLEPADIEKVVCTHHHVDHTGLGGTLKKAGARVIVSSVDAKLLESFFSHPEKDKQKAFFYGRHAVPKEFAERVSLVFPFFRGLAEEFEPDETINGGDAIDLGGILFQVLHTPGHTPGHICLFQPDAQIIFTGDCVITKDATHISMKPEIQAIDPVGDFIDSLKSLRALNGVTALPGHGPLIKDLAVKTTELIDHLRRRSDVIADNLSETPQTAYQLAPPLTGKRSRTFSNWVNVSQTAAFLAHLVQIGRAQCIETQTGLVFRKASK